MPRPRARCLFELGGQWIATVPNRPGFYRFWNDARNGRTDRESLGTEDFEEAKIKFAEIVLKAAPATENSLLSIVLEKYFTGHSDKLPSAKPARHAGHLFLDAWGEKVRVNDLTEDKQREFVSDEAQRGASLGYTARNMTVLSAALRFSGLNIKIFSSEKFMRETWKITAKARRKAFIPTDQQLANIWHEPMPEDLRRWLLIAMTTACRPEAGVDLGPDQRIRDAQAVDLNPEGRVQNNKTRPIVRAPKVLISAMERWERLGLDAHGGKYCGYASVDSVDSALERVCLRENINLPKMSVYSVRHKVTTVMRAAGVPREQIDWQLGHVGNGSETTRDYGEYSPEFQKDAAKALGDWMGRIKAMKPKREFALNSHKRKAA